MITAAAGPFSGAIMDRRSVLLAQARLHRRRALLEPSRSSFWLEQAAKWEARAAQLVGPVVVTVERPDRRDSVASGIANRE